MTLQPGNQIDNEGQFLLIEIYPANKRRKQQQNSPFLTAPNKLMDITISHQ